MPSFPRSAPVATILFLPLQLAMLGDDTSLPLSIRNLRLPTSFIGRVNLRKPRASYQALLKMIRTSCLRMVPAEVGLVRAMLRQQKIDEALDAVNTALAAHPNSAALLAAKGDVQFRRGEMPDAELSYLAAKKLDPKEVRAYLGLARLYAPTPCTVKPMTSYRSPTKSLLTISRCRGHGYGCFREKRDWRQWRPTSAGPILMMKKKQSG